MIVLCGDGGYGAPDYAPYDRIIVTAGAWDLAPDWLAQLGPGGRLVLPLSVRGIQLCLALERGAGAWRSRSACRCGFIRMAGRFASPEPFVPVGPQPGLHVQADDGRPLDADALYAALTGPVADVPTGVQVVGLAELGDADLWVTLTGARAGPADDHRRRRPLRSGGAAAAAVRRPGRVRRRARPDWAGDFGVAALIPARLPPPTARRRP